MSWGSVDREGLGRVLQRTGVVEGAVFQRAVFLDQFGFVLRAWRGRKVKVEPTRNCHGS